MLAEITGRLKTMSWLRMTSLRNGNRFPHSLGYVVHDWFLKVFPINYGKPIMSQTKDCVTVSLQKAGLFYHSDYSRWLLVQLFVVRVEWVICLAFCTDEMEPDLTGVFRSDPITTKKTWDSPGNSLSLLKFEWLQRASNRPFSILGRSLLFIVLVRGAFQAILSRNCLAWGACYSQVGYSAFCQRAMSNTSWVDPVG